MKKEVYKFLEEYSFDPLSINRLIVSTFVYCNDLNIADNNLLASYLIREGDNDYAGLTAFRLICQLNSIEELIQIFEFIISPEEKVVTGAVYTPDNIRNYIVDECFSRVTDFTDIKVCDPACGCAGFLYTVAKTIKRNTGWSYHDIFANNIFGLDIQDYSVTRSMLLLNLVALSEGEIVEAFFFQYLLGNALDFKWAGKIENYTGFQVIVGNPPYVCSRNMDEESLKLLDNWNVTKSGHPDLYIPFFQIGYENLMEGGELGLITVNTFIKSINGRALRSYFSTNKIDIKIINFGGEQIFKHKNTYTCLCFLRKAEGSISYKRIFSSELIAFDNASLFSYNYADLNDHDGWNLVDSTEKSKFINRIEATGKPFKDLFTTRNGIATLRNDIYKFIPTSEDKKFYYFSKFDRDYKIEKGVCRKIVNANKIKNEKDLVKKQEQIIFPYVQKDKEVLILPEETLLSAHLRTPNIRYLKRKDLLFYNGIAVISNSLAEIQELKSLLESDIFFDYIKNTTKDYSSGYISMSRNYLKKFGIPKLSKEEKAELKSPETDGNIFWEKVYSNTQKITNNKG